MVVNTNANLGASVVPDLMRVYESLTQSKTPQASHHHDVHSNLTGGNPSESSTHPNHYRHSPVPSADIDQYQYEPDPNNTSSSHSHASSGAQPPLSAQTMAFQPTSPLSSQHSAAAVKKIRPRRTTARKRPTEPDRNGSDDDSKPRKKKTGGDGRWAKRFAWPDELHRDFVSAVFDVGLKHSSPSAILEQMTPHEQVSSERIKSHLQKYRLHRQKSKKEFMSSYESTMLKMKAGESDLDPTGMSCGEVAAHLAFTSLNEQEVPSADPGSLVQGGILQLPQLTEDEKHSPVGASMGYLMGLFFSLKQQLHAQRAAQGVHGVDGPVVVPSISPQPSVVQDHSHPGAPPVAYSKGATVSVDGADPHYQNNYSIHHASAAAALDDSVTAQYQQNTYFQSGHQPESPYTSQAQTPITQSQDPTISASSPPPSSSMPPPDARNNSSMEERDAMKRDMLEQMEFQTKMRKMKEQEISKYSHYEDVPSDGMGIARGTAAAIKVGDDAGHVAGAPTDGAMKGGTEAIGMTDAEFWKSDEVLDDQLFEFLMND